MKKFCFVLLSAICFIYNINAQIAPVAPSASSIADASVAVENNWSAFRNTASLAYIDHLELSMQYENHSIIREMSWKSAQAGLNAKYLNIGLSFSYFGYSLYNEMIAGVGFARNFSDKFSMGLQFNYYTAYFSAGEESRYRGALLPQAGISSRILPRLSIGFQAFNPFQTNIKTENTQKRIPSVYSFGTNYEFSKNLVWLTQVDKEVSSDFRFATGFEYTMLRQLTVKLGAYGSDYLVPCIGFGLHLDKFHFNLNGELHPLLGLNILANLKYRF
ncbi:MAG: hypothetical protein H6Q19_1720 [Bacteroidetes bacterium]|nr:hypothetical protein [Bacteroidota bacterium]